MSQKRATQRRWIVYRTFEPDRLSSATLVQAYSQLVPAHIRVLRLPPVLGPAEAPLNDQRPAQIIESIGPQLELAPALVIEAITKQEVA